MKSFLLCAICMLLGAGIFHGIIDIPEELTVWLHTLCIIGLMVITIFLSLRIKNLYQWMKYVANQPVSDKVAEIRRNINTKLNMSHQDKYDAAKEAINEVFKDTDVDQETTLQSLQSLSGDLDLFIEAIESDLRDAEDGGKYGQGTQ